MHTLIEKNESGQRLDAFLARLMPDMGLRGRRRLCEQGLVLVQNRPATAAYRVRSGQAVSILNAQSEIEPSLVAGIRLIARNEHWAAVYKPAGLHSVSQAGSPSPSVEALLPALFAAESGIQEWYMLNRLDHATSGMVMVALNLEGEKQWQSAQAQGLVSKHYVALVQGAWPQGYGPEASVTLRRALQGRAHNVMPEAFDSTDFQRFTHACGLLPLPDVQNLYPEQAGTDELAGEALSLVGATIMRGGRHQIRAHLALFGHALWGDTLYGACPLPANTDQLGFYLHHGAINLPGFEAICPCPWSLPWAEVPNCADEWLNAVATASA